MYIERGRERECKRFKPWRILTVVSHLCSPQASCAAMAEAAAARAPGTLRPMSVARSMAEAK